MKVMILCGGYGARLAGVGVDLPKPMVPLGGKPCLRIAAAVGNKRDLETVRTEDRLGIK